MNSFEKRFGHIRYASIIAVIASAFGSLLMYVIGAVKVYRAYVSYFMLEPQERLSPLPGADVAITFLVQAIDAFLIALVLMIFGGGIYNLFIRAVDVAEQQSHKLFRIRSIGELKRILAELVIIILMVKFLETALSSPDGYHWQMLVLPAGVLMLAAAVKVINIRTD